MIEKTDVKLMQSKRLTDEVNGGGVITAIEVPDGEVNNLFGGIARTDRATGRSSLRKAYVAIDTDNTDTYYGAHIIISEPQSDAGVDVVMMSTKSDFDERDEAAIKISQPFVAGASSDSDWFHYPAVGTGKKDNTSAYFKGTSALSTLPEFTVGSVINIGGTIFNIIDTIDYYNSSVVRIDLDADILIETTLPIYDEFGNSRWIATSLGDFASSQIYIEHETYVPGPGDAVVLNGQLMTVASIDNADSFMPRYHFNQAFKADIPEGAALQSVVQSANQYAGVTRLAADALLIDNGVITVNETDKFIFPVGSEGIDPEIIGLDSSMLRIDRKVNIIEPNSVIVIHSTTEEVLPNPVATGNSYALTGAYYQLIELYDALGVPLDPVLYSADLIVGEVTMSAGVDLSAYTQPFVAHKRYEDMRLVTAVDHATKQVTLGRALSREFSVGAFVSSVILLGDILSSYANFFDQATWTGVWQDTPIGSSSGGTYNDTFFPLHVSNSSAISEKWALVFTSQTTFKIIGEGSGEIGVGQIDTAPGTFTEPENPETGKPYFKLPQEGWGVGWSVGNVVRFETIGCNQPVWFIRTTQQSDAIEELTDQFTVQIRGDVS